MRFREVLQGALDAAGWGRPRAGPGRGIGLFGRHISGGDAGLVLTAESDGTLTVISPTIDQGSGLHTILRQLAAEEMRVPVGQVRVVVGNTDTAPRDSGSRASRMMYVAGRTIVRACAQLREQLLERAARILEGSPEQVDYGNGEFWLRQEPGQRVPLTRIVAREGRRPTVTVQEDLPYPEDVTYFCGQVAEVEVDRETGEFRIRSLVTAHDVGTVINPITHQGQIDGGVVMGLGQALMEELVMQGGRVTNASLGDYKLPTASDIPGLKTVLVRSGGGLAPYEAKAIGEFANNAPPAAIANALADAVGVRLTELPLTAERLYHAPRERTDGNEPGTTRGLPSLSRR